MLSVDHSNIDGPPLAVKCVRKFGSALGGEVTSVCVFRVRRESVRIFDWKAKIKNVVLYTRYMYI